MKLCIPTLDDRGLEGMPSDHFGSAPFFTFVDTDTGEVKAISNGGSNHMHGACLPLESLKPHNVDAIVCRGLGRRALARLQAGGVQVYVTLEKDVAGTLEAFRKGILREMSVDQACQGHSHGGHGGGHGHGGHGSVGGGRWQ